MSTYKPQRKTASGLEDVKLPYSVLTDTPTIPSVGNGTITIKQAGAVKGTFTTNQSGDTTIELANTAVIQTHTTTNANYPLLFKQASGITTTGATTNTSRYANNIYVNPSTGTVYANDFVVGGQSVVGASSLQKISSETNSINIQSTTVGAYLNLFGAIYEAGELSIGSNSIALDSGYTYFLSVQGMLYQKVGTTYYWHIMVTLKQEGGSTVYSDYTITTTSGFNISDDGQVIGGASHYSGILCG